MPVIYNMVWNDYLGKLITITTRNCFSHESLKLKGYVNGFIKLEDGGYLVLIVAGRNMYIKADGVLYFIEGDI